jgi:NAD(P)-dependent dehydrogenase (short-subunit alcohol dehydrogenase family)
MEFDLEDEKSILKLCDDVYAEAGKVDILVNNAVLRCMKGYTDTAENFTRSMIANATGLFVISRAFGDRMAKAGSGSIINIGSYMGILGLDHANYKGTGMQTDNIEWPSPAYHYEKGGMLNFTRWAASVLGKYNIRVNCVSLIGLEPLDGERTRFHRQHAERTLLKRCCGNEDLKGGIVYLASEASNFVTGTNLVIDGGYSAI